MIDDPLPINLDNGTDKATGFVMKITLTGMLVELDKIAFKIGTYFTATFELEEGKPLSERVRSIKHYDKFFRKVPKKKLKEGEVPPEPKQLAEFHFSMPTEYTKTQITKFMLRQQRDAEIKKK